MKRFLTAALILSFVVIAVFGFLGMGHGHGCIATLAQGGECSNSANPFAITLFHLDAFKEFSTAVFGDASVSLISALGILVFAMGARGLERGVGQITLPVLTARRERSRQSFRAISQEKFSCWLALHENSPSTI